METDAPDAPETEPTPSAQGAKVDALGRNPWLRRVGLAVLGTFGVLLAFAVLERIVFADKVMPGVEIAGVDLGGRTEQEAYDELAAIAESLETEPLVVTADGKKLTADPADFGVDIDVEETLAAVRKAGRSGNPIAAVIGAVERRFRDDHVSDAAHRAAPALLRIRRGRVDRLRRAPIRARCRG